MVSVSPIAANSSVAVPAHSSLSLIKSTNRKQNDSDVFNKVSGTTGLTGSADATFVLEKEKRASDTAKLYVTGRDTPYQEYTLRFRDCSWELVERKTQEQLAKETIPDVLFRLVDFMRDKEEWAGTATELLAAMGETETVQIGRASCRERVSVRV